MLQQDKAQGIQQQCEIRAFVLGVLMPYPDYKLETPDFDDVSHAELIWTEIGKMKPMCNYMLSL